MLVLDRAFVLGETGLRGLSQPEKGVIDHDMRSELKGIELEYRGINNFNSQLATRNSQSAAPVRRASHSD